MSVVWKGGLYIRHSEVGDWELRLEMQSHDPINAVFLNDHRLGYLPVKDWTYAWVSARFSVPHDLLRQGYNELTIRAGLVPSQFRSSLTAYDEVVFRRITLERLSQ